MDAQEGGTMELTTEDLLAEWRRLNEASKLPPGWATINDLARASGLSRKTTTDLAERFGGAYPDSTRVVLAGGRWQRAVDLPVFLTWYQGGGRGNV
jgi:hypothetical protein